MERCVKCLMADTKPGIVFDDEGVCQACHHHEKRATVDYGERMVQLRTMCDKFKQENRYDCLLPVSGGKDSWFQVKVIKEDMGMNPLLCTVTDHYDHTWQGQRNLEHLCKEFDCDLVVGKMGHETTKKMTRIAFEEFGSPTWPIDRAIYCWPLQVAEQNEIQLVFYGENVSYEYGGFQNEETSSALSQIRNDVAKEVNPEIWKDIPKSSMNMLFYPSCPNVLPQYLSYYIPWSGWDNYQFAKSRGFRPLTYIRTGFIEQYDQIDSTGYLFNVYMKYVKYGFGRATDVVGYWLRDNLITLKHGMALIEEHDHLLDRNILQDFNEFAGYGREESFRIIRKHIGKGVDLKGQLKWEKGISQSSAPDGTVPG